MNPSAVLRSERLRPLTRLAAAWGVWAALGLAAADPIRADDANGPITPAGTVVTNEATVTYSTGNGEAVVTVAALSFTVGQLAGADVEPPRVSISQPGRSVVFTHSLINVGNGTDSFDVLAVSSSGWSLQLYHDTDGDGLRTAADTVLTGPVTLAMGGSFSFLVGLTVPSGMNPGEIETIDVSTRSHYDASVVDVVSDQVHYADVGVETFIDKLVDRTEASPGDLLAYTLRVRLDGAGPRDSVFVIDGIPPYAAYEAGTLQLDGVSLTDGRDADAGWYEATTGTLGVDLSSLPAGTDADILFQARIDAATPIGTQITNRANLIVHTPSGTVDDDSPAATTQVGAPGLRFTKSVSGMDPATEGDSLVYVIEVINESNTLSAADLEIIDSLPAPLSVRSTSPAGIVSGAEVRWTVALLGPGETARFEVVAEVGSVLSSTTVVNQAHLVRDGASGEVAVSPARTLVPTLEASIALSLEAEVVEIQLGEVLPLRASVTNNGQATVADVVVELTLPEGTLLIGETLEGAFSGPRPSPTAVGPQPGPAAVGGTAGPAQQSVVESPLMLQSFGVQGHTLTVRLPGELRPQETVEFRYLLMVNSAGEGGLLSRATADAHRGGMAALSPVLVGSNQAQVFVALARNRPLETRTVIGKVFHDVDGDGFQDAEEVGVGGVDVVTADGEMVTTDDFGKLSFTNLRPGRHAFRVDPATLPDELTVRTTGPGQRLQVLEVSGWNSPRLSFALVSREDRTPDEDVAVVDSAQVDPTAEDAVRVEALRTEAARDADERNAFLSGPAIRVSAPVDGFVSATNRVYIGVQSEPSRPVTLFRGDSIVVEARLMPNGVGDFVGVQLQPGPQVFRVRTLNSWGNERWDSIVVHQTGRPVRLVPDDERLALRADGRTVGTTRVRLYDAWGVPVVNEPFVTVRIDGGSIAGPDVDRSSVGHQLRADRSGWVTIQAVGGRDIGEGALLVEVPDATVTIPIVYLPAVRPLFVTGVGQVSLGAAGDDFAALTAQGRIGDETALTLSFDSRRLDQGRDVFGRNFDPLEEGQHPILGDASVQRSLAPSRYRFSARVERNLDWLMFGDVQTSGFSDGMELARYGRSLPGAAMRMTTGGVVWNAFGASTTQALRQQQIRGSGTSGPFELGAGVLPGTEEVRVQVRALENPTRVVSEQLLERFAEYQIDYARGTLLLKQPLPAADVSGNPIFLFITYEGESGGDQSPVWGLRASSELNGVVGEWADSVPVSVSFVNDAQPGRNFSLGSFSTGLVQDNGLSLTAELAVASSEDSTGVATRIRSAAPLWNDRVDLSAEWTQVGDEFTNPANISLQPGTNEIRAAAGVELGDARVALAHERQSFAIRDLARRRTTLAYTHQVTERIEAEARLAADATESAADDGSSGAGEYKVTWSATSKLDVFAEGRNGLWSNGSGLANRGAYYGGGASLRLAKSFALEARQLRVTPAGTGNPYNLTSVGLTSDMRVGTKAWGSYQITGGIDGQTSAALVGLNHRFNIGPDWRFSTMVERRNGVGGATIGDPVLASPFEQPEENYTAGSIGTEYLPQDKPYRASLRAERRAGNLSSSTLATLAGDIAFGGSLALLTRQEFMERDMAGSLTTLYTRERSSLWGVAYRPTGSDALNVLLKLSWKDAINPFGSGVLVSEGEESRIIGALEAIWAPRANVEFGGRFATRSTRLDAQPLVNALLLTRTNTQFIGLTGRWFAKDWIGAKIEARGVMSDMASGSVWDIAPGLVVRPLELIEVEVGHRFGDLQDPDFAVRSGDGWYVTVGTRITEDVIPSVAGFWRSHFGG